MSVGLWGPLVVNLTSYLQNYHQQHADFHAHIYYIILYSVMQMLVNHMQVKGCHYIAVIVSYISKRMVQFS